MDVDKNDVSYRIFTAKAEADKAIHSLKGLLTGIGLDGEVNEREIRELNLWVNDHLSLIRRYPFKEFLYTIKSVVNQEIPMKEAIEDLLWLTQKYDTDNVYYDVLTSELQILHGICHGILADGVISDEEVIQLGAWLEGHQHLSNHYPYDEISSILLDILSDGKIDEEERAILKAYLFQFADIRDARTARSIQDETIHMPLSGFCSTGTEIVFDNRKFCFTGALKRLSRKELFAEVVKLGGQPVDNVTEDTDYLVVGDNGNAAWAFSCYGRKVEKAISLRKKGHRIAILHEFDFCDVIDDRR